MTTGLSGTAQISGFFNPILEAAMMVARESVLMPSLVTQFNGSGWADRKVSIYPQITAQQVAETDDFANPQVFEKTALATFTPIEVAAQSILTDRRNETDPENARADCARELGLAVSDKIESDLLGLFTSLTTESGNAGGTASFALSYVATGIAKLRNAKARGPFYVVLHPYQWLDVWAEIGKPTTSLVASDAANAAMRDYFVANLVNAQWYQHSSIAVASNKAIGAVFSREAFALDTRRAPSLEPERDASKRAWELNINAGYAKGILRDTFGVKMTSDATTP